MRPPFALLLQSELSLTHDAKCELGDDGKREGNREAEPEPGHRRHPETPNKSNILNESPTVYCLPSLVSTSLQISIKSDFSIRPVNR
jgi:hypothetical protein